MATFNKLQDFAQAVSEGKHNLTSDQIVVALTNTTPSAAHAVLTDLTEISYTNLSSRNVTTNGSTGETGGTYKLVLDDLVLTAGVGGLATFQYVYIYNDTSTSDNLIGYYDYGATVTLNEGETFTVDFDGSAGVLTIG